MTAPPRIRDARPADAAAIAPLLDQLGYPSAPERVRARLAAILERRGYAITGVRLAKPLSPLSPRSRAS